MQPLTDRELVDLVKRVFDVRPEDRAIAILVDVPTAAETDRPEWRWRRETAAGWVATLRARRDELGVDTHLYLYRSVARNNADLPAVAVRHAGGPLPERAEALDGTAAEPFVSVLRGHGIAIAPTEHSATAPLKLLARTIPFRAATMPGFTEAMVPALRLDYGVIGHRVEVLRRLLDEASGARFVFGLEGGRACSLRLDLRHRSAHASSGVFHQPGTVGNLPSGESYIVPYEGERPGDPSGSAGELPVQLGDEVVVYRVVENHAVEVLPGGPEATREAALLAGEPAYGNLAELGVGVLGELGVEPTGEVLLDEKLGLHIAFGRSDHFGGQVGAQQFSRPEAVVHIDRVYVPRMQPKVRVSLATLERDGRDVDLVRDDRWVLDFPLP